jgi:hypothetical protein
LLVTSRERLAVQGEREFPVSPLTLPAADDLVDLERLAATPSIAMLLHPGARVPRRLRGDDGQRGVDGGDLRAA